VQRHGTANSLVPNNSMRFLQLSHKTFIILANNEDIVIVLVRGHETNHGFSNSQSFFFLLFGTITDMITHVCLFIVF